MAVPVFTCDSSRDLCFNGGICSVDNSTGFNYCECLNDDFGPDTSWFHDPSCTLPKNFYLGQLIEMSIVSFIALILLARLLTHETGSLRRAAIWSGVGTFSTCIFALGELLQDGTYEVCGVALTVMLTTATGCAVNLIHMQISALKGMEELIHYRLFSRSLQGTFIACFIVCFMIGVSWVVLCRTDRHNTVTRTTIGSLLFWNTLFCFEIAYYCSRLMSEIQRLRKAPENQGNSAAYRHWDGIISRLNMMRMLIIFYYCLLIAGVLPLLTMHLTLGSAPYGFVLIFLAIHCMPVLSFAVIFLGKQREKKRESEKKLIAAKAAADESGSAIGATGNNVGAQVQPATPAEVSG